MNEIFPVLCGCGLGLLFSFQFRVKAMLLLVELSAVLGVVVTVVTGEWNIGWQFLIIDIPSVAASSFAVIALRNKMKRRIFVSL